MGGCCTADFMVNHPLFLKIPYPSLLLTELASCLKMITWILFFWLSWEKLSQSKQRVLRYIYETLIIPLETRNLKKIAILSMQNPTILWKNQNEVLQLPFHHQINYFASFIFCMKFNRLTHEKTKIQFTLRFIIFISIFNSLGIVGKSWYFCSKTYWRFER